MYEQSLSIASSELPFHKQDEKELRDGIITDNAESRLKFSAKP